MQRVNSYDYADEMADYSGIYGRKIRGRMKKRLTLEHRKMYNMGYKKDGERL
jgi:hypothetical protein